MFNFKPKNCSTCRFSEEVGQNDLFACYRFPPQVLLMDPAEGTIRSQFPTVYETAKCGEFKPK